MKCWHEAIAWGAMTRTITLRLSESAYAAVKRYAEADGVSMNAWVEATLDTEDMRRRCQAHGEWIRSNPQVAEAALRFHEANQAALAAAGLPNVHTGQPPTAGRVA
jgi:hypothetical protein